MSFVENMNIFAQSLLDPKDKNFGRNWFITIVVCVVCIYVVSLAFKGPPKFKTVKLFFDEKKTECLHIAEIEIKDKDGKIIDLNNHVIELSSQYTGDGVDMTTAKKMIDKDPKTYAHTLCGTGESITITFKEPQFISAIKITNRSDGNSARIVGASLSLQPVDGSKLLIKQIEKDQAVFEFEHKEGVLSLKA